MIGTITDSKKRSDYQPRKEVQKLTERIKQDYQIGYDIQHRNYREFNDMSILDRMNVDQSVFNSYVAPKSTDRDESWREIGVRPITRNKIIGIVAHMAASLMYPGAFAQNGEDEEDKASAKVMEDMLEWNIENTDYELSMFFTLIAACVNPVAYLGVEFVEAMQTIKKRSESGEYTKEEVIDNVFSGMQFPVIPVEEMFIANAYQFSHQKQRFTARRRVISLDEAEALYGEHKNFKFVDLGSKAVFDTKTSQFYDADTSDLDEGNVEEFIYRNRREDMEVPFINGIYLGDENTENNAMKHRDNEGHPKYPEAKTGYEPIDSKRFYYYKSAAFKLSGEQGRVDKLHRMVMDGTYLGVMPPIITTGGVKVDASVIFPRAVTNFPKDTTINPLSIGSNLAAGYNAIADAERMLSESSQDSVRGGATPQGDRTAYEIARIEQNAIIKEFGIFGRMIADLVENVGNLMVDNIVCYQTLGELGDITSSNMRMKFATYLLPEKTDNGQKVTKEVQFTDKYMGREMDEEEMRHEGYKMMEEEGGMDSNRRIKRVNPHLWSKLKFKITIAPDSMVPRSKLFEEEKKLKGYSMMMVDPYADQEAVSRDFLFDVFAKGESDKYMKKLEPMTGMNPGGMPGGAPTPGGPVPGTPAPLQPQTAVPPAPVTPPGASMM